MTTLNRSRKGADVVRVGGTEWRPSPQTRILDVGPPDARTATALRAVGAERYLALTAPESVASVRLAAGDLAPRFHPLSDLGALQRCSADLLVLRAPYTRATWGWGELAHFRWIAVERAARAWDTPLAIALARGRGHFSPRGEWRTGDGSVFDVFEMSPAVPRRARIYFSPAWGVEGLAQRLAEHGIDYAVLRWFEDLPHIEHGEDLDILVADEDAERFRALIETEPGIQPIDLYSVSGLDGTDFRSAAYYIPYLAEQILARAVVHPSGMRVPSPPDHLRSLAYHAAYHKGASSGLASALVPQETDPEHDYAAALTAAAERVGETVPVDLEGLDDYLAGEGWRPPTDALRRFANENEWLSARLGVGGRRSSAEAELAVFLVRERAVHDLGEDEVRQILARWGFQVIAESDLDEAAREQAARALRGGNWGPGPYPVSGGRPQLLLACVHYAPYEVSGALRERYPHLSNADIFFVKQEMRDEIALRFGADGAFNGIHSADDEHEAWHYLEVAAPDAVDHVRTELHRRAAQQAPGADVVRTLSRGRRARVDVVESVDGLAVRKTFAIGAEAHFARELRAMDELAGRVAVVPSPTDRGHDWFTLPLFQEPRRPRGRLLPRRVLAEIVCALHEIRRNGFVLVDAKPENFIVDRTRGLTVLDLEFAYPVTEGAPALAEGPEFVEPDRSAFPDLPAGDSSYEKRWLPATGMPLDVLLHASPIAQHLHRLRYIVRSATVAPGSPLRAVARRARTMAGVLRRGARRMIVRRAWGE